MNYVTEQNIPLNRAARRRLKIILSISQGRRSSSTNPKKISTTRSCLKS